MHKPGASSSAVDTGTLAMRKCNKPLMALRGGTVWQTPSETMQRGQKRGQWRAVPGALQRIRQGRKRAPRCICTDNLCCPYLCTQAHVEAGNIWLLSVSRGRSARELQLDSLAKARAGRASELSLVHRHCVDALKVQCWGH